MFDDFVAIRDVAKGLYDRGITSAEAAKLDPSKWQSLGITRPADMQSAVSQLKKLESASRFMTPLGGEEPPAAAPVAAPEPAPQPAAPAAAAVPDQVSSVADFLRKNGYDAAKARKLDPNQWRDLAGVTSPADVAKIVAQLEAKPPAARSASVRGPSDVRRMMKPQDTPIGPHGPIFDQFKGDATGAIKLLKKTHRSADGREVSRCNPAELEGRSEDLASNAVRGEMRGHPPGGR